MSKRFVPATVSLTLVLSAALTSILPARATPPSTSDSSAVAAAQPDSATQSSWTFDTCVGRAQDFSVPAGVTSLLMDVEGSHGGEPNDGNGGEGGFGGRAV